jgi:multimeric flavodoxin WrbA
VIKIAAFSSSPRDRSNSDTLVDRILDGAQKAGADVKKVLLHDKDISACTACDRCQSSLEAACKFDDDMADLLVTLKEADVIVFGSPIYFFSINAQMKVFLDRTYALGGDGNWEALKGKRLAVALTFADDDVESSGVMNAIQMFRGAADFLQMDMAGVIHASCADPGEILANTAVLEEAEKLGARLVAKTGA